MNELTYYKLKLAITETQLIRVQAEHALLSSLSRQQALFIAAGLDPDKQYRFNDANHELVLVDSVDTN